MIITTTQILRRHWAAVLMGLVPTLGETDIDSDGRTRVKTIRGMVAEGVLFPRAESDKPGVYQATPRLLDTEPAEKPDLAVLAKLDTRDHYNLTNLHGLVLEGTARGRDGLTVRHYRYIAEHPREYTFIDPWNKIVDPVTARRDALIVRDAALEEAIAARLLVLRTEEVQKRSLAWGLRQIGALDADAPAESFRADIDEPMGFNTSGPSFGSDPDQWVHDAARVITELRERIKTDLARLETVARANAFVLGRGGWGAFVAEYRAMVAARVAEGRNKAAAAAGEAKP